MDDEKIKYRILLTEEETSERFIQHIKDLIDYWEDETRRPTSRGKLEGLAFSILTLIDGETDHPPCILRPMVSTINGEEWLDIGHDIGGSLHELLCTKKESE